MEGVVSYYMEPLDRLKESFLWAAAKGGRVQEVNSLLDMGANVNWSQGELLRSSRSHEGQGDEDQIKLKNTNNPSSQDLDDSPLLAAARAGHTDVVNILLAHGADSKRRTDNGNTALHLAAAGGHEEMCNLLIRSDGGSDPITDVNESGHTPFDVAVECGFPALAKKMNNTYSEIREMDIQRNDVDICVSAHMDNHDNHDENFFESSYCSTEAYQSIQNNNSSITPENTMDVNVGSAESSILSELDNDQYESPREQDEIDCEHDSNYNIDHVVENDHESMQTIDQLQDNQGLECYNNNSDDTDSSSKEGTGTSERQVTDSSKRFEESRRDDRENCGTSDNYSPGENAGSEICCGQAELLRGLVESLVARNKRLMESEKAVNAYLSDRELVIRELEEKCMLLEKDRDNAMEELQDLLTGSNITKKSLEEVEIVETQLKKLIAQCMVQKERLVKDQLCKEQEKQTCVICQVEPKSVLLMPCRHFCVCKECGNRDELDKCPLCRETVVNRIDVYS